MGKGGPKIASGWILCQLGEMWDEQKIYKVSYMPSYHVRLIFAIYVRQRVFEIPWWHHGEIKHKVHAALFRVPSPFTESSTESHLTVRAYVLLLEVQGVGLVCTNTWSSVVDKLEHTSESPGELIIAKVARLLSWVSNPVKSNAAREFSFLTSSQVTLSPLWKSHL